VRSIVDTGAADVTAHDYAVLRWAVRCAQRDVLCRVAPCAFLPILCADAHAPSDGAEPRHDVAESSRLVRVAMEHRGPDARRIVAFCSQYKSVMRSAEALGHTELLCDLYACVDALRAAGALPDVDSTHPLWQPSERVYVLQGSMVAHVVLRMQRVAPTWATTVPVPIDTTDAMALLRVPARAFDKMRRLLGDDLPPVLRSTEQRDDGTVELPTDLYHHHASTYDWLAIAPALRPAADYLIGPTPCEAALSLGLCDVARHIIGASTRSSIRAVRFPYVTYDATSLRCWLSCEGVRRTYALHTAVGRAAHLYQLALVAARGNRADTLRELLAPQDPDSVDGLDLSHSARMARKLVSEAAIARAKSAVVAIRTHGSVDLELVRRNLCSVALDALNSFGL